MVAWVVPPLQLAPLKSNHHVCDSLLCFHNEPDVEVLRLHLVCLVKIYDNLTVCLIHLCYLVLNKTLLYAWPSDAYRI